MRAGSRRSERGVYEPGNLVTATWRARLAEHLGQLQLEPGRSYGAQLLDDPLRLACLEAVIALAETALPERAPYPQIFDDLLGLLDILGADDGFAAWHLRWELGLLAELGYGLDLTACAVTGGTEDLAWVSPRTGRAVSRAAGAPWRDRLLVLPRLLGGSGDGSAETGALADLLDGLNLTGWFLDRHIFAPQQQGLPDARTRYLARLVRLAPQK